MRRWSACRGLWLAATLLSVGPTFRLSDLPAQVGHPPSTSPYRDLPAGGGPSLVAGYFTGGRGRVDVGVTDGPTLGVRYDFEIGGPTRIVLGATYAGTGRHLLDPTADSADRLGPVVRHHVVMLDGAIQLLLTGAKTWRGLAPYAGGAIGLVVGGAEPAADSASDYVFGTKFTAAPLAGVRWQPARRVRVQIESRLVLWRLSYPLQFKQFAADGTRVLPGDAELTEWTAHPWITLGVGWTF